MTHAMAEDMRQQGKRLQVDQDDYFGPHEPQSGIWPWVGQCSGGRCAGCGFGWLWDARENLSDRARRGMG
jgi:hypothetical protein